MKDNLLRYVPFSYGGAGVLRKALALIVCLGLLAGPAQAQSLRLLAFGDSLTQGYGLIEQDGFVPQMQAWMEAHGHDVTIVNGGVSGDTTAGGAARIAWSLSPDIKAVMVALGGNDLLRGLAPEEAKANLEKIIIAAGDAGVPVLLVGMQAPMNYGAEYKEKFDGIYEALAEQYRTLYEPGFLAALGETPEEVIALMQSDGVHPNKDGVAKIVARLGPRLVELAERAR